MHRHRLLCCTLATVAFMMWAAVIPASTHRLVESFDTRALCDTFNTTAVWDTVAGELRMPPFVMTQIGAYNTAGNARGVTIEGRYAYVADYSAGVQIVDIADPESPTLVATYNTASYAKSVWVDGNYAYVADYADGLIVLNVTNPASPTLAGSCDTPGSARDVVVDGNYAYVADYGSGLQVINVTNPASPVIAGSYDTAGNSYGLTIAGNYAYVADGAAGLQVINITTPASPTLAGTYNTAGTAEDVAVFGDLAYVADYDGGLQIIDIANPLWPALVTSVALTGNAYMTAVDHDRVYVAAGAQGLVEVDITNPAAPFIVSAYDAPGNAYALALSGNAAFVADDVYGLLAIRTGQLIPPVAISGLATLESTSKALLEGRYAFWPTSASAPRVFDFGDPRNPSLVWSGASANGAGLAIAGNDLFMTAGTDLLSFRLASPAQPVLADNLYVGGTLTAIALAGDYAYIAGGSVGLKIVNIANPSSMAVVTTIGMGGANCAGVAVAGNHVYAAAGTAGVQVVNVTNPAAPTILATWDLYGATDVVVHGDCAYVACDPGVVVLGIENPAAPIAYGGISNTTSATALELAGGVLFVTRDNHDTREYNIVDPANVTLLNTWAPSMQAASACGDVVFLTGDGLSCYQTYQRTVQPAGNDGYSLAVPSGGGNIVRARLTATQTDSIAWSVSADNGSHWTAVPRGAWTAITVPGPSLKWTTDHFYADYLANPTCTEVQIEWLLTNASIDSVRDIPGDQGGQVRVTFSRSGYDWPDEATYPIATYNLLRRVDSAAVSAAVALEAVPWVAPTGGAKAAAGAGLPCVSWHDRLFLQSGAAALPASFPAGTWEIVGNVSSMQQDQYTVVVPTLADSTLDGVSWSVYMVTAHTTTPSVWYASPPDSGYSRDNLAPHVPTTFVVAQHPIDGNDLSWDPCPDRDFEYFNVYRGATAEFMPGPASLVHQTTDAGWVDTAPGSYGLCYKVSAVDDAGNESACASASAVTGVPDAAPSVFALRQNVPNPFNPATAIGFSLAQKGRVRLVVYDVSGRLVRVLVDEVREAGSHRVQWNGTNDRGERMGSGIYVCRLESGARRETRRMTLIK